MSSPMQEQLPVVPEQRLKHDENGASALPRDVACPSTELPPAAPLVAIATTPRTRTTTEDPLVFDLTDCTRMLETEDYSDALARLRRAAAEHSKTVVMRLTNKVELSAHDVWALNEPTANIEGSVLDAWGLLLGRNLCAQAKVADCDAFAHVHKLATKSARKGHETAVMDRQKAVKSYVVESNVRVTA